MQARQFLARGFVERKLLFTAEVLRTANRIHDEAERSAAAARRAKGVAPYTGCVPLAKGSSCAIPPPSYFTLVSRTVKFVVR